MRSSAARLAVALALVAAPLLAHAGGGRADDKGSDDGHVSLDFSGGGEGRTWSLHTMDGREEVRVQLVAHVMKSSIHVRILDPDGREVADMQGNGELDVDSGPIHVVDHPAGRDEARRGAWTVEVTTGKGDGSFELRWWGLAPPASASGQSR